MTIEVASKRRRTQGVGDAVVLDVTSRGVEPWVRFSPFFPHGGVPVPFTPDVVGASVEGVWQALKVFEGADVDVGKLSVTTMKGLKRTVRKHGPVRGHRAGLHGTDLLDYRAARRDIYLPTYRWVLDHRVADLVDELRALSAHRRVVLLDYTTNGDVDDTSTPLSHAALIVHRTTNTWPT
ncbi:DUF6939 family protein [Saccharothrix sp.]|uniref:DUF6939 family protein n=1 Tax=Saccharothrix sp. TaxID=1873460 RepID=UPI00281145C9|nr:hypothetical protein [Saccharothrix sp.]